MLSHMLDCQLFDCTPADTILTNVLLHAVPSIGTVSGLAEMTGELWPSALGGRAVRRASAARRNGGLDPERRDVLSGLFFMLTLGAYLGYVRHGRTLGPLFAGGGLLSLGLMAKPMLVTLPATAVAFGLSGRWGDSARRATLHPTALPVERPGGWRLVLEKLPLVALAAGPMPDHATNPQCWRHAGRLAGAVGQCRGFLRGVPVQFSYPVGLSAIYPLPPGARRCGGWPALRVLALLTAGAMIAVAAFPTSLSAGFGSRAC